MKIRIDNIDYDVEAGKNLLETCIGLGLNLPYFCYHPAMGSVGACRQCAVKKYANADDKKGRMIMSCMEPVAEGMIISIDDPEARQFRAGVIEGLMTNHPHDCPVCDEGGECHLQDMTVMTGHDYRRFTFKKRTFVSQYLGPFIHHEMNRCIQCYRCVRFYRDYAGGKDLNVFGSANMLYFGRKEDGILESEFSGNLIEVCPTGVFTDKTLQQHYTRKWDLTNGPSICVHCSVGCNTMVGERYGSVRRVLNRYHGEINGYFLCDRGRFGYEFASHPSRIKSIRIKNSDGSFSAGSLKSVATEAGMDKAPNRIVGIGSPRASLESNYALMQLVGKDNFFNGISQKDSRLTQRALELLKSSSVNAVSLKEIEKCDAAFIINEDITQSAPVMALSIRQMSHNKVLKIADKAGIPAWNDSAAREIAQHEKSPLFIVHPYSTKLDDVATLVLNYAPDDIARMVFAVASAIDESAPVVPDMDENTKNRAARIASQLLGAERPLIVTGITGANDALMDAITNIICALTAKNKKPSLAIAFPENNSVGIAALKSGDLEDAIASLSKEPADTLIILENNIYRRIQKEKADSLLEKSGRVIVIDHLLHETAERADIILPAAVWAEASGTIVNHQGLAQRYYPALPCIPPVKEGWDWIVQLMNMSGRNVQRWQTFDDVANALSLHSPDFRSILEFPASDFRILHQKIARQTMRFSGRTAMNANITVSEPAPPDDLDSPLRFSMEGFKGRPPATLIPYYWSPGWNSQQASNKYLDNPNGSNIDGEPGKKILAENGPELTRFFTAIPKAFSPMNGELYLVPLPQIFGSEELSSFSKPVMERMTSPFLLINESEKQKINAGDNPMMLSFGNLNLKVNLRIDNSVPAGIGALTCSLPGMDYLEFPFTGTLVPV